MSDIDWSPVFASLREEVNRLRTPTPERRSQVSEIQTNDFIAAMEMASRRLNEERTLGRVEPINHEVCVSPKKEYMVKVEIPKKQKRQIFKLQEEK